MVNNEKSKEVMVNTISAYIIKGISLVISLATIPIFMNYFESQIILGVWFTLLSFVTWVLNFDLGIGNGLRNKLVKPLLENDTIRIKEYISSAYISILFISFFIMIIGIVVIIKIDWNNFFNIGSNVITGSYLRSSVLIVFIGIIIQMFLKTINSILYAMQKSAINDLCTLLISLLQLMIVILLPYGDSQTNLINISYAYAICSNIPLIILTIIVFCTRLKICFPNIKFCKLYLVKEILSLGGSFFGCQILFMLLMNTNEILISKLSTPNSVVEYQIYFKIFNLISMLFMVGMSPIWSATTKAIESNDIIWLKGLIIRLKRFALLISLIQIIIIPIFPFLLKIWLGSDAPYTNYFYCLAFSLFGISMIFQSLFSCIASGFGSMKVQLNIFTVSVILKFILSPVLLFIFPGKWICIIILNAALLAIYSFIENIHIYNLIRKREKRV